MRGGGRADAICEFRCGGADAADGSTGAVRYNTGDGFGLGLPNPDFFWPESFRYLVVHFFLLNL